MSKPLFHPFSQVHPSEHHPLVEEILELPPSSGPLFDHLLCLVSSLADITVGNPPSRPPDTLRDYAWLFIEHARITTGAVLAATVHLARATRYESDATNMLHRRILLGALICATKYVDDAAHRGSTWAYISRDFSSRNILEIERDWLTSISYNLSVLDDDILNHYPDMKQSPPPVILAPSANLNRDTWPQPTPAPHHYEKNHCASISRSRSNSDSETYPYPYLYPVSAPTYSNSSSSRYCWTPESSLQTPSPMIGRKRKRMTSHQLDADDHLHFKSAPWKVEVEDEPSLTGTPHSWVQCPRHSKRYRADSARDVHDRPEMMLLIDILREHGDPIPNALKAWERSYNESQAQASWRDRHPRSTSRSYSYLSDAPGRRIRSHPYSQQPHAWRTSQQRYQGVPRPI